MRGAVAFCETAAREGVDVVRCWTVVRETFCGVVARCVILRWTVRRATEPAELRAVAVVVVRAVEFAERTAASAKPMHTHNVIRKDRILFIPFYNRNHRKKVILGQAVFTEKK